MLHIFVNKATHVDIYKIIQSCKSDLEPLSLELTKKLHHVYERKNYIDKIAVISTPYLVGI